MAHSKGTSDQDIGRPESWREGRYQKSGRPVDQSVRRSQGKKNAEPPAATQVNSVTTWYRRKRVP
jgi:hypothetical protein